MTNERGQEQADRGQSKEEKEEEDDPEIRKEKDTRMEEAEERDCKSKEDREVDSKENCPVQPYTRLEATERLAGLSKEVSPIYKNLNTNPHNPMINELAKEDLEQRDTEQSGDEREMEIEYDSRKKGRSTDLRGK